MLHVNRFIEKVSLQESRKSKDVILSLEEARGLRDEIAKLLSLCLDQENNKKDEVVSIEIKSRGFK